MATVTENPTLQALIDFVYDATVDRSAWRALGEKIAPSFGGHSCAIQLHEPYLARSKTLTYTTNITERAVQSYEAYYREHDAWTLRAQKIGLSKVFISQDLISDREFLEGEFFHDWCKPIDLAQVVGLVFPVAGRTLGGIGVHRPVGGKPFGEPERKLMEGFFPHLRRSLQICGLLDAGAAAGGGAAAALVSSGSLVLVVDSDRRIVLATSAAESCLGGDGVGAPGGVLTATDPALDARLRRMVHEAALTGTGRGSAAGGTVVIPRAAGAALVLTVMPLREGTIAGASAPLALVLLRDPDRATAPRAEELAAVFGLTPAESRLAATLAQGISVDQFARTFAVSPHTARSHLKRIMQKTHTKRQSDLVAVLIRGALP